MIEKGEEGTTPGLGTIIVTQWCLGGGGGVVYFLRDYDQGRRSDAFVFCGGGCRRAGCWDGDEEGQDGLVPLMKTGSWGQRFA